MAMLFMLTTTLLLQRSEVKSLMLDQRCFIPNAWFASGKDRFIQQSFAGASRYNQ